jgi:hypothetical protein
MEWDVPKKGLHPYNGFRNLHFTMQALLPINQFGALSPRKLTTEGGDRPPFP